MSPRFTSFIESHPLLGWVGTVVSFATGAVPWLMGHTDDFAKVFGLVASIFGTAAGYYMMRIQRRAWKRGEARSSFEI